MKKENIGVIEIVVATFLFGFIPILVRYGDNLGIYNLSFFRVLVAAIFLFILSLLFNKSLKIMPLRYEKGKMLLFGAVHGFIIIGYFLAIAYLQVSQAALLIYSSSIWMTLFSYLILKEKIHNNTWFALAIALVGVVLVLSTKGLFSGLNLLGVAGGLFAGVMSGFVFILSKTIKKYDRISLTFWQNLIALPFFIPLVIFDPPKFTTIDVGIVLLLGVFCTVIPFILVFKGLQKIKGQIGGILLMLDIVFIVLLAYLFFGEIPTTYSMLGGVLLIIGSYLSTRPQ